MPLSRWFMTRGALLASLSFVLHAAAFAPTSRHDVPHRSARGLQQTASFHSSSLESIAPQILAQSILPSVALILPLGVRNTTARGSGFVVDVSLYDKNNNDGEASRRDVYLLTAAHVALPGHRIQVVFYDDGIQNDFNTESASMPATVVGREVRSDLALLRIHHITEDFVPPPPLVLSTKSTAALGTPAYAMGYPSGGVVGPAMTSGIVCGNALGLVSDVGRLRKESVSEAIVPDNGERNQKTKYIVTDAAMAGGMSGGPLVDGSSGCVLGINALINMELRALGNYVISASEAIDFLNKMSRRLSGAADGENENDGRPTFYRVMLYNDPFNKRVRVQDLLQTVAKLNATESNRIMMDAHTRGTGLIREFCGDDAEAKELCDALRKEDLLVEVEAVY